MCQFTMSSCFLRYVGTATYKGDFNMRTIEVLFYLDERISLEIDTRSYAPNIGRIHFFIQLCITSLSYFSTSPETCSCRRLKRNSAFTDPFNEHTRVQSVNETHPLDRKKI